MQGYAAHEKEVIKSVSDARAKLAGTENRIAISRKKYNEVVKIYNTSIRKFPKNIFAGMFGFGEEKYFEAAEQSKEVPKVNFGG